MFKWCTAGSPNSAPWRIFGKEGNRLEQIGQMKHRPTNADLEAVFYNGQCSRRGHRPQEGSGTVQCTS